GVCVPGSVALSYPEIPDHLRGRGIPVLPPPPEFRSVVSLVREWEADLLWPLADVDFDAAAPLVPLAAQAANRAMKTARKGRTPHVSIAIAKELRGILQAPRP
ncbi:MAG TPA: hypothetical protein VIM58_05310, partial [Candidatus Methylacidiphilales bacterium]